MRWKLMLGMGREGLGYRSCDVGYLVAFAYFMSWFARDGGLASHLLAL